MPLGDRYETQNCSIARTLEVIGERWTLLILRDAFHGLTRFEEFQRSLGVASNILSARLKKLVELGIFEAEGEDAAGRRRGYRLTDKGLALSPVLGTMTAWGDRYELRSGKPAVVLVHDDCGHGFLPELRCDQCGQSVGTENTHMEPGPGASAREKREGLTPPQLAAQGGKAG